MLPGSPVQAQGLGKQADAPVELINPIGGSEKNPRGLVDTRVIFGNAVQITLGFLGSLTLAVFVFGGYLWLTSAGNSDKVQQGTKTMLYAVMGLFIIFGAYGILTTVIEGITGKTLSSDSGGNAPAGQITPGSPQVQPESDSCSELTRNACDAREDCTYVVFVLPANDGDVPGAPMSDCVNAQNRDQVCRQFHALCQNGLPEDSPLVEECAQELATCLQFNRQ